MITGLVRRAHGDRGSLTPFVAIIVVVVVMLIGLVADVSGQMLAVSRAHNVAAEAARAGGQAIDVLKALQGGGIEVVPDQAIHAATSYLTQAGATGTVEISADRKQVTVTSTITYQLRFLGAFGYGPRTVTATSTAHLINQ